MAGLRIRQSENGCWDVTVRFREAPDPALIDRLQDESDQSQVIEVGLAALEAMRKPHPQRKFPVLLGGGATDT